jgi:hypothetical protein
MGDSKLTSLAIGIGQTKLMLGKYPVTVSTVVLVFCSQGRSDQAGGAWRSRDGDWGVFADGQGQWVSTDDTGTALRHFYGGSRETLGRG